MALDLRAIVKHLLLSVGDKLSEDLHFLHTREVFKSPEVQGMLRHSSKVKDRLLHLTPPATKKEAQVLEAAYLTPENTALIHLLSNTRLRASGGSQSSKYKPW